MARAVVVVESMFGNTRQIGAAIAAGLSERMSVEVVDVGSAPESLRGVDLVVVGGPTHAFGMSRRSTRDAAIKQGASSGTGSSRGVREWLAMPAPSTQTVLATFDTRIKKRGIPGSAAKAAGRRLRRSRRTMVDSPQSFYVAGKAGPLLPGELERAQAWGHALAEQVVGSSRV